MILAHKQVLCFKPRPRWLSPRYGPQGQINRKSDKAKCVGPTMKMGPTNHIMYRLKNISSQILQSAHETLNLGLTALQIFNNILLSLGSLPDWTYPFHSILTYRFIGLDEMGRCHSVKPEFFPCILRWYGKTRALKRT